METQNTALTFKPRLRVAGESNKAFYTVKIQFRESYSPPFNWTDRGKSPALRRLSGRVESNSPSCSSNSFSGVHAITESEPVS